MNKVISTEKIKKIQIFLTIALFIILLTPFIYICIFRPDRTFWDNSMGDMLATILALIAGIPVALWIDRLNKTQEERKKYSQDRKRELIILMLIRQEIDFSYTSLFLHRTKGNIKTIRIQPLKSVLWESLVKSQELKYIEDPKLFNTIASAYYVLNFVKKIEEHAYIALRTLGVEFDLKDGTTEKAATLLLKDARKFDALLEDTCKEALKKINEKILQLQK